VGGGGGGGGGGGNFFLFQSSVALSGVGLGEFQSDTISDNLYTITSSWQIPLPLFCYKWEPTKLVPDFLQWMNFKRSYQKRCYWKFEHAGSTRVDVLFTCITFMFGKSTYCSKSTTVHAWVGVLFITWQPSYQHWKTTYCT